MSELSLGLLGKTLKKAGYSQTLPRKIVFKLLLDQAPQTVAELSRRSLGQIDRASLYRTLSLFEEVGIIRRVHIGWKYKFELSEHFSPHHHHVYCLACGAIVDVKEPPQLKKYIEAIACTTGFEVTSHSFELEGLCATCRNKK